MDAPVKTALQEKGLYTRCYCEENIYHLIQWLQAQGQAPPSALHVVFISNDDKRVPIWMQESAGKTAATVWDYHVVLVDIAAALIWDLDSLLPCPVNLNRYIRQALKPERILSPQFHRFPSPFMTSKKSATTIGVYVRKYRMIVAEDYLRAFASDRRHMLQEDGSWQSPPPSYPCIKNKKGECNTLGQYWTMKNDYPDSEKGLYGWVMDESSFLLQLRFSQKTD